MDDDDDWVGAPPEGRISADRANPGFWRGQRPVMLGGAMLCLLVVILLVAVIA